jgi:hypothetical protein
MARSGKQVLLYVNTSTDASPIWNAVGFSNGLEISAQRDNQTVSHKDSNTSVIISGNMTRSYTISGFHVPSDVGQAKLITAINSDLPLLMEKRDTGEPVERVRVKVTSFSESHPVDGASTYNFTLSPIEEPYNV